MSSFRARPAGALATLTLAGLLWLAVAPVALAAATLREAVDSALAADLTATQAEYDLAIGAYVHLTGQPRLPDPLVEPEPPLPEPPTIAEDHPALASASAALSEARAERERVSADRRGHPVLSRPARPGVWAGWCRSSG
jgi:hypothetical protein